MRDKINYPDRIFIYFDGKHEYDYRVRMGGFYEDGTAYISGQQEYVHKNKANEKSNLFLFLVFTSSILAGFILGSLFIYALSGNIIRREMNKNVAITDSFYKLKNTCETNLNLLRGKLHGKNKSRFNSGNN